MREEPVDAGPTPDPPDCGEGPEPKEGEMQPWSDACHSTVDERFILYANAHGIERTDVQHEMVVESVTERELHLVGLGVVEFDSPHIDVVSSARFPEEPAPFARDSDLPLVGEHVWGSIHGAYVRIQTLGGELVFEGGEPPWGSAMPLGGLALVHDPDAVTCNLSEHEGEPAECCCSTVRDLKVILKYDGCSVLDRGEAREIHIGPRRYLAKNVFASWQRRACWADGDAIAASGYIVRLKD